MNHGQLHPQKYQQWNMVYIKIRKTTPFNFVSVNMYIFPPICVFNFSSLYYNFQYIDISPPWLNLSLNTLFLLMLLKMGLFSHLVCCITCTYTTFHPTAPEYTFFSSQMYTRHSPGQIICQVTKQVLINF